MNIQFLLKNTGMFERLGIMTLSSVLKAKGHKVKLTLTEEMEEKETLEYFDEKTGFYAMEKWTGWHASMMAIRIANGELKPGAISVENAMSGAYFLKEGKKRGYKIDINIESIGSL